MRYYYGSVTSVPIKVNRTSHHGSQQGVYSRTSIVTSSLLILVEIRNEAAKLLYFREISGGKVVDVLIRHILLEFIEYGVVETDGQTEILYWTPGEKVIFILILFVGKILYVHLIRGRWSTNSMLQSRLETYHCLNSTDGKSKLWKGTV